MRGLTAWCCALACTWAGAQAPESLPLPQYPAGAINSVVIADRALLDAKTARLEQEKSYQARRQACYREFLAERCLAPVREQNNLAEKRIRSVEVEARAFKRDDTAREVAAKRAAIRAQETADAPRRAQEQAANRERSTKQTERNSGRQREFEAGAATREARALEANRRAEERRAARVTKEKDEQARRAERAERARAHEEKVAEVLRRAKEKEEQAREKAAKAGGAGGASGAAPVSNPGTNAVRSTVGTAAGKS